MKTFILETIKKGALNPYDKVTFSKIHTDGDKPWLNKPYSNTGYTGGPLLNEALQCMREKCDMRATINDALATRHVYTALAVFYVQPPRIDSYYGYDELMEGAGRLLDDPKMMDKLPKVTDRHFCNMLILAEEMDTLGLHATTVVPMLISGKASLKLIIEVMTKLSPIALEVLSTHILYLTGEDIFRRSSLEAVVRIIDDGINEQPIYPQGSIVEQHTTRNPYRHPNPNGETMSILGVSVANGKVVLECTLTTNGHDISEVVNRIVGDHSNWTCIWKRTEIMGSDAYRVGLESKVAPSFVRDNIFVLEGPAFNGGRQIYFREEGGTLVCMPPEDYTTNPHSCYNPYAHAQW